MEDIEELYYIKVYGEKFDNQNSDFKYVINMGMVGFNNDWLLWCKENTIGQWNYYFRPDVFKKDNGLYSLLLRFEKAEDAVLFKLIFK